MTRAKRTSRERVEKTPLRAKGAEGKREAERYAGAFARVRLVRAWIAAVAAMASMVSPYVALLERLLKWWSTFHRRRAPRLAAVLASSCVLDVLAPTGLLAHGPGAHGAGPPADRETPSRFIAVTITHGGNGSASVYTNSSGNTSFTVTNTGSAGTVLLSATDCTGSIGNCSASPAAGYLASSASMPVTVSFTGGMTPGTGWFTLKAHDQSNNSLLATYTVTVTVTADPNAPTLSLTPHLGDRRDVSACVADCFESTFSYGTPAYISLDVPRSTTLLYRSGRAYPHGTLTLDVNDPLATATSFRLKLKDPSGAYLTFSNTTQELYFTRNASGATRIVAQFPATSVANSAGLYTAEVTAMRPAGVQSTALAPVRIMVLNSINSPYGAGVDIVGIQRIWFNQPGGVLVTDGTGSATFFAGTCDANTACTYTSPAGEFSTLSTSGGWIHRVYPDGTYLTFWPSGHHRGTNDRFGNATIVDYAYNSAFSEWVPSNIIDPTGQVTYLSYHSATEATYKAGSLSVIYSPGAPYSNIGVLPSGNLEHLVEADHVCCAVAVYDSQHRLIRYDNKAFAPIAYYAYRYGATLDYTETPSVTLANGTTARSRVTLRDAADTLLERAAAGKGTSSTILPVVADLRAKVIDPVGNVTLISLSKFGSPTKTKAPLVPADSNEYDASTGQLLRSISPTGRDVRYTYEGGKLKTVNDLTLGKADTLWYASQYALPTTIRGNTGEQWFWYDSLKTGWPLKKTAPSLSGPYTWHYADQFGRDTLIADPSNHQTSYVYEPTGLRNLQIVRAPNGQPTTFTRDAAGRDTMVKDPYGNVSKQRFDALNRPTWTVGAQSDTTRFHYGALGPDSLVDAKNQRYKSSRNAAGWVTSQTHPDGLADSARYDANGRVVRTRSRAGRVVELVYDSLGRLSKRHGLTTQTVDSLWYDPNGKWVATSSRVGTDTVSRDTLYTDEQNRQGKATTNRASIGAWRVESNFSNTDPGRSSVYLYKRVSNADSTVTYTYFTYGDAQKRLTSIWGPNDTTNFHYNGESLIDSVSLRAGLAEKFTYSSSHVLATRGYTGASWVDDVLRRWYRSDSLARVTERGGPDSLFQAFTYDSAGRLQSWTKKALRTGVSCVNTDGYGYTCTGATPWTLSPAVTPTYDKVGNPTDLSAVTTTGNRLTTFNGVTMTYDADGYMRTRVTSTTTDTLTWDEFGRLVSLKRVVSGQTPAVTTFAYDGFGRRIKKATSATTIHYLWDGDQIVAELDGSGVVRKTYTYYPGIDQPRSVTTGGQTYFFSAEPDGTVNGVIRKSDRTVVAQYAYTPWGELESAAQAFDSVSTLRWKGLPYDPESGLYYMRARYYDPKIRRFVSEDPVGFEGGINGYTFGSGDPINNSDPTGLFDCNIVPRISTIGNGDPDKPGYFVTQEVYWVLQCTQMTERGGTSSRWGQLFRELAVSEAQGYAAAWTGGEPPRGGSTGYLLGLASQAIGVRAPVTASPASAEALGAFAAGLRPTTTVAGNASSRPFLNSTLTIREIMSAAPPRPDPMGVVGAWRWDVAGAFNGSQGTWQLVVNAHTREIYHFMFLGTR